MVKGSCFIHILHGIELYHALYSNILMHLLTQICVLCTLCVGWSIVENCLVLPKDRKSLVVLEMQTRGSSASSMQDKHKHSVVQGGGGQANILRDRLVSKFGGEFSSVQFSSVI
jgi:hypothetical protein